MFLTLTSDDWAGLSPAARTEILGKFGQPASAAAVSSAGLMPAPEIGPEFHDIDMEEVADLTLKQVQTWMEAASDKTKLGLRVFAEKGPIITAQDLIDAGIENVSHFQSRTTMRTRTVTGDRDAFLLGWDNWEEADEGQGKYAVTPITHQSLRRYFQLG